MKQSKLAIMCWWFMCCVSEQIQAGGADQGTQYSRGHQ